MLRAISFHNQPHRSKENLLAQESDYHTRAFFLRYIRPDTKLAFLRLNGDINYVFLGKDGYRCI